MIVDGVVSALRVPAELASLAFVRCAMACLLERVGWPVGDAGRILLASGEAIINAIEHGSGPGAMVQAELVVGAAEARVSVRDAGRPGAPRFGVPSGPPPPPSSPRGRGLVIMRGSADELSVRALGAGSEVSMRFARPALAAAAAGRRRAA